VYVVVVAVISAKEDAGENTLCWRAAARRGKCSHKYGLDNSDGIVQQQT